MISLSVLRNGEFAGLEAES